MLTSQGRRGPLLRGLAPPRSRASSRKLTLACARLDAATIFCCSTSLETNFCLIILWKRLHDPRTNTIRDKRHYGQPGRYAASEGGWDSCDRNSEPCENFQNEVICHQLRRIQKLSCCDYGKRQRSGDGSRWS